MSCRGGDEPPPFEPVFFVDRTPRVTETIGRAELATLDVSGPVSASVVLGDATMRAVVPASTPSRLGHQVELSARPSLSFAIAVATDSRPGPFAVEFRVTVDDGNGDDVVFTRRVDRRERNRWLSQRIDLDAYSGSWVRLSFETLPVTPSDEVYPLWGNPVLSDEVSRAVRPDLIMISVDCLRPDHVRAYGYERDTTPSLDRLADEGVVFERASSTSSWTLPSHMSMLTGLTPSFHGVTRNEKLSPSLPYLPESLARAGYETIGVVTNAYLSPSFGFERGFHSYRVLHRSTADRTVDAAIEQLDAASGRNVFLFLHLVDPHWRYEPPPEFRSRFGAPQGDVLQLMDKIIDREPPSDPGEIDAIVRLYDGEVAYTDQELGRLFDALRERRRYEGALIVVTSDHGEAFWEHGYWQHSDTLYEEMIRVPLIARWPGGSTRGRVDAPVSLVDLFPTFARAGGLDDLPSQGVLLSDLGDSPGTGFRRISETLWDAEEPPRMKVALRKRGHKYVSTFVVDDADAGGIGAIIQEELYDLDADPGERIDLSSTSPLIEELRIELRAYLESARKFRSAIEGGESVTTDEILERRLRSLGYVH